MSRISTVIACIFFAGVGYVAGKMDFVDEERSEPTVREYKPEISLVELQERVGDGLKLEISGPVRVIWSGENVVENDGVHTVPLGQVPGEEDVKLTEFSYVGNEKTMKFYPADSYHARGTEVRYRRFFMTKEEAVVAGFEPTQGVE